MNDTRTTSPATGSAVPAPTVTEGQADEIVTSLYRRFKEWSKRGFGPDDVTWCEVKADIVRLLATVAPSPVGEGQAVVLDSYAEKIMAGASEHERSIIADLNVIASESGYWNGPSLQRERKDFWTKAIASTARGMILRYREAALAAEAPKPASAGGWRSVLCPALLYPTMRGWLDEDSAKRAAEQASAVLYDSFIAAEADTAKEPNPKDSVEFIGEMIGCRAILSGAIIPPAPLDPPAADRLAQTVTDAEVDAAIDAYYEATDCEPSHEGIHAALEAALRARESAPAQEDKP